MKERIAYPDIARGIGLLYIIECHIMNRHITLFDSFALPIFFVIMGMFFKPGNSLRDLIKKKFPQLIIPLILLSIPKVITLLFTDGISQVFKMLINPYKCIYGVGWFLVCMFFTYIIYQIIYTYTEKSLIKRLILSAIISLIFYELSHLEFMGHRIILPFFLSTACVCLVFVAFGQCIPLILNHFQEKTPFQKTILQMLIFVIGGGYSLTTKGGELIESFYYNQPYLQYILFSISGVTSALLISKSLPKCLSAMSFWGKHSLLLLTIHPYIITICSLFMVKGILMYVVVVLITTLLIIPISKYFPILEGKAPIKFWQK